MRRRLVQDVVEWQVQAPTLGMRLMRAGELLLDGLLSAASMASANWSGRPRVPLEGDEPVPVEPVYIRGRAPWMPAEWAGPQLVEMTSVEASINPAGMAGRSRVLPLADLRILAATPRRRSRRPKQPASTWVVEVTDGCHTLTLTGPWLSMAWLGHIAQWPEP